MKDTPQFSPSFLSDISVHVAQYLTLMMGALASLGGEFWAGIAGAVVGGAVTLFAQRQEQKASRREREEDRKQEARAHGYSLLFKVTSIHSSFGHIKAHVDERLALAEKLKAERVSSVLLPLASAHP